MFAEVRAENWLRMADSQREGSPIKDKPRMVGNTMMVGSKEKESKRKTPALKKNRA